MMVQQQKESRKLLRILDKAKRHRPVRASWADRAVARGWYHKAAYASVIPVFSLPFAVGVSLLLFFMISSDSSKLSPVLAWVLGISLFVIPLAVVLGAFFFRRAIQKRSSRILAPLSPGVSSIVSYLPFCPMLIGEVRRWVEESGDANLSAYEYDLICRAAPLMSSEVRAKARMSPGWMRSYSPQDKGIPLDQDFYDLFPQAPRFLAGNPRAGTEKEDYASNVKSLDFVLGHLDLIRTRKHEEKMDQMLAPASEVGGMPRVRL